MFNDSIELTRIVLEQKNVIPTGITVSLLERRKHLLDRNFVEKAVRTLKHVSSFCEDWMERYLNSGRWLKRVGETVCLTKKVSNETVQKASKPIV